MARGNEGRPAETSDRRGGPLEREPSYRRGPYPRSSRSREDHHCKGEASPRGRSSSQEGVGDYRTRPGELRPLSGAVKPEWSATAGGGTGYPINWRWYDAAAGGVPSSTWGGRPEGVAYPGYPKQEGRGYGWDGAPPVGGGWDVARDESSHPRAGALLRDPGTGGPDPFDPLGLVQPDPSHYTVGTTLVHFRTPPPTPAERDELRHARGTSSGDRRRRDFLTWVATNGEARFEGKGDAHALTSWISCLRGYFHMEDISNSALQAQFAAATFRGRARNWWNAHLRQRPYACLSFAQLAELVQAELVPAAESQTAFLAWSQLQYTGRPDQFLKQLDSLAETFPLPPLSLMQMATAPLGRAFAAEVRNAGLYAHPSGSIPYPRLRQIIANKLETLRPPTEQPMPRPGKKGSPRPGPPSHLRAVEAVQMTPPSSPDAALMSAAAAVGAGAGRRASEGREGRKGEHAEKRLADRERPRAKKGASGDKELEGGGPGASVKRGKGPYPCFVCGEEGHRWGSCDKRKGGKGCGVCGSAAHPTVRCPQRYFPEAPAQLRAFLLRLMEEVWADNAATATGGRGADLVGKDPGAGKGRRGGATGRMGQAAPSKRPASPNGPTASPEAPGTVDARPLTRNAGGDARPRTGGGGIHGGQWGGGDVGSRAGSFRPGSRLLGWPGSDGP